MQATFETTMSCGSCVNKVRPFLDGDPSIAEWEADLKHPKKPLRFELRDDARTDLIHERIRAAGFNATLIEEDKEAERSQATEPEAGTFSLTNYKPLFLVVSYVIGASVLMEYQKPVWGWMNFMNNFMGFFFLAFAFFKLLDIQKFADAFATYDLIARRYRLYGLAYPWLEFGLGLLFVTRTGLVAANLVTAIVMSVGLVGVVNAVRKKQAIQCACLGTVFNLPMSVVTIVENGVMIVMSIAMLLIYSRLA